MGKMTMVEAINMAHAWEMAQDPSVVVLGEDVGTNGGVFRATAGLQQRFGRARVQDTPLAEGLIAGEAIGLGGEGLKRVAEIQFMGFIYPALDQIASHMARLRNRTRGRLTCPVVLRMPRETSSASIASSCALIGRWIGESRRDCARDTASSRRASPSSLADSRPTSGVRIGAPGLLALGLLS